MNKTKSAADKKKVCAAKKTKKETNFWSKREKRRFLIESAAEREITAARSIYD